MFDIKEISRNIFIIILKLFNFRPLYKKIYFLLNINMFLEFAIYDDFQDLELLMEQIHGL